MIANIIIGLIIIYILFGPQIIIWLLINMFKFTDYMINEYKVAKRINKLSKKRKYR